MVNFKAIFAGSGFRQPLASTYKKTAAGLFGLVLTAFVAMPAYASVKTVEIDVNDTYPNCDFVITCDDENAGEYYYYLYDPSGKEYPLTYSDGQAIESFKEVTEGKWIVLVQTPKTYVQNEDGTTVEEEGPEIGRVSVSLKQLNEVPPEEIGKDKNNISVGRQVNGLKIYYKDQNVVVEWTDDTVGGVNVRVIDAETLEVLANTNVVEQSIEVPVPMKTRRLTISVIPANKQNEDGSGQTFTYDFYNNPQAKVTFPSEEYVNHANIDAELNLREKYSVDVYVNDILVNHKKDMTTGSHTLSIPLTEGENHIVLYVIDASNNMRSYRKDITLDTKAPTLMIESNYNGLVTSEEQIEFRGKVDGYSSLLLNNKTEIEPAYDGTFIIPVTLNMGENKFLIKAEDNAGNVAEYPAVITRVEPPKQKVSPRDVLPVVMAGAILVGLLAKRIFGKKKSARKDKNDGHEDSEGDDSYPPEEKPLTRREKKALEKLKRKEEKERVKQERLERKRERKEKNIAVKKGHIKKLKYLLSFFVPAGIVYIVMRYLLIFTIVMSASMVPTLRVGDMAIGSHLSYLVRSPMRGDIVFVKNASTENKIFVKRVIGMPGDHISFKNGFVYINNKKCDEKYLDVVVETNSGQTFDVPEGCYFVLGDNREDSHDSRFWADPYVKKREVIGKVVADIPIGK